VVAGIDEQMVVPDSEGFVVAGEGRFISLEVLVRVVEERRERGGKSRVGK